MSRRPLRSAEAEAPLCARYRQGRWGWKEEVDEHLLATHRWLEGSERASEAFAFAEFPIVREGWKGGWFGRSVGDRLWAPSERAGERRLLLCTRPASVDGQGLCSDGGRQE